MSKEVENKGTKLVLSTTDEKFTDAKGKEIAFKQIWMSDGSSKVAIKSVYRDDKNALRIIAQKGLPFSVLTDSKVFIDQKGIEHPYQEISIKAQAVSIVVKAVYKSDKKALALMVA